MSKNKEKDKEKKKKEKITYIDDGHSLADMSGLNGGPGAKGTLRDQSKTFFSAMKMMIVPMLITMGIITAAFFILRMLLILSL